ncbi:MAG TPA: FxLYD domain-containing protein [Polyangiales bacterium]|nr:FxLYD domain-containing protein [Polyangiales bacterium]
MTALPGGNGVLEVFALTLRKGPSHSELYAALRNEGDVPACDAALSVELFDREEQSIAAGITGLLTQRFYRLTDDSGSIAACVGPGDVTMAAVTDLPVELELADVGHVVYRCPYFALDVVEVPGLRIERARSSGRVHSGTLVNDFDVAVSHPSVSVFALSRAERPLGVAIATEAIELAPGARWSFTAQLRDAADDYAAYPAAAIQTAMQPRP